MSFHLTLYYNNNTQNPNISCIMLPFLGGCGIPITLLLMPVDLCEEIVGLFSSLKHISPNATIINLASKIKATMN